MHGLPGERAKHRAVCKAERARQRAAEFLHARDVSDRERNTNLQTPADGAASRAGAEELLPKREYDRRHPLATVWGCGVARNTAKAASRKLKLQQRRWAIASRVVRKSRCGAFSPTQQSSTLSHGSARDPSTASPDRRRPRRLPRRRAVRVSTVSPATVERGRVDQQPQDLFRVVVRQRCRARSVLHGPPRRVRLRCDAL